MNKWHLFSGVALILGSLPGGLMAQETPPKSPDTKIIIIEQKVDQNGNKTVNKTVREGNFTDQQIDQIINDASGEDLGGERTWNEKGYLGVMIENADNGVRVTSTVDDSPAEEAGLQAGDVITGINDNSVATMDELVAAVGNHKPGETVDVHYLRDGKPESSNVTLGTRDEPVVSDVFGWDKDAEKMQKDAEEMAEHAEAMQKHKEMMERHEQMGADHSAEKPRFGVYLEDVQDGPGVKVTKVSEGSVADIAGVKPDDIITSFNGVDVNSADDLIKVVKNAPTDQRLKFTLLRDGKEVNEKVVFEN